MTLLLYPILNAFVFGIVLLFTALWIIIVSTVCILYFILKPIMEIKTLSLGPSRYLLNKNIPEWLVRILMIPLYPLNLIVAICTVNRIWNGDKFCTMIERVVSLMMFFVLLPCLMFVGEEDE